jgi:adenylate cyclase
MTLDQVKRKLAAILSADVKGYSRLMGEDEEWTLRTLNAYKEVMGSLIQQHRGLIVGTAGDSLLAEFASVVDAVQCAVEIQQVLRAKNALLPETRRMDFRIGVNLGDVIEEGDSIYGDGVNIAARLESLAEAGGICISGSAYEQIENKLPLRYEYLGEHQVKNIVKPVRVYRARIEPETALSPAPEEKKALRKRLSPAVLASIALVVIAAAVVLYLFAFRHSPAKTDVASKEKMAYPMPDKPSIAVLPFVNLSGDPKQEFFSDGITEDIITALSKIPNVFVIARNSTFTYKGKAVRIKQVSEELGVRYVLEGSIQRSGDQVRITAQLIDALTGNHLWSERYDRNLKDLFAMQDEVTMKVLVAIQVKLTSGEHYMLNEKHFTGKQGLDCYLKYLEGRNRIATLTIESNNKARQIGEEIVAKCPKNPFGYQLLGGVYYNDIWTLGSDQSPQELIENSFEMAQKALALDDSLAIGHGLLSIIYGLRKEHAKASEEGKRAVALDPNDYATHSYYARSLLLRGMDVLAISEYKNAIRLNPKECGDAFEGLGEAYRNLGRLDDAISAFKQCLLWIPGHIYAHLYLIDLYMAKNQEREARAETAALLRINPNFSLDAFEKTLKAFRRHPNIEYFDRLRKAGLK